MAGGIRNSDDLGPLSEINVTPFVDVMLVLLIIFMVTAPFMETGIGIELPQASGKAIPKSLEPVTLNITKDRQFIIDKKQVPGLELRKILIDKFKDRKKKEIFIRADGSLTYEFVARTMATAKSAGITKIGLVTEPTGN